MRESRGVHLADQAARRRAAETARPAAPRDGDAAERIARARRECQFRAGVLMLTPELPPGLALELQVAVLAIGEDWLAERGAAETVVNAWVAFKAAVEDREALLASTRATEPQP